MRIPLLLLFGLVVLVVPALADDSVVPYSPAEIDNLLKTFKQNYKKSKVPEDAVAVLEDLKKAYRYLEKKADRTKDDERLAKSIVQTVAKGLGAKHTMVQLECSRVLGELGDEDAAKPLARWMEKTVLDMKDPPAQLVEFGFQAMAWVGATDSSTLDMLRSYATGKHQDAAVASHALNACTQWRFIKAKDRKELCEKVIGYVGGLQANMRGGDPKKKASFEQKYNLVKEKGLEAAWALSGAEAKFADGDAATAWWQENKKKVKWEDYVGPRFREPVAAAEKPEEKPEAKPEDEKPEDKGDGEAEGEGDEAEEDTGT